MAYLIDDSCWPDDEILTEYAICKAVYQINPEKAEILYPTSFVEKLDELMATRGISALSLQDLVLFFRRKKRISGNYSQESNSNCGELSPKQMVPYEFQPMVLTDRQYSKNFQNSKHCSSRRASFPQRSRRSIEDMLRMPNIRTKLAELSPPDPPNLSSPVTIMCNPDEIESLRSTQNLNTSARKVRFSSVKCKRRRSTWDPTAIPIKSLLKKAKEEDPRGPYENLASNQVNHNDVDVKTGNASNTITTIGHESAAQPTLEKKAVCKHPRNSPEIVEDVLVNYEEQSQSVTHEQFNKNPFLLGPSKRPRSEAAVAEDRTKRRVKSLKRKSAEEDPSDRGRGSQKSMEDDCKKYNLRQRSASGSRTDEEAICFGVTSVNISDTVSRKLDAEEAVKQNGVPDVVHSQIRLTPLVVEPMVKTPRRCVKTTNSRDPRRDLETQEDTLNKEETAILTIEQDLCTSTPSTATQSATFSTTVGRKRRSIRSDRKVCQTPDNHPEEEKLECPMCSKWYLCAKSLRAHVVRVHRDIVEDRKGALQSENMDVSEPCVTSAS